MGGNESPLGLRKQNGGDSLRKCKLAPTLFREVPP